MVCPRLLDFLSPISPTAHTIVLQAGNRHQTISNDKARDASLRQKAGNSGAMICDAKLDDPVHGLAKFDSIVLVFDNFRSKDPRTSVSDADTNDLRTIVIREYRAPRHAL